MAPKKDSWPQFIKAKIGLCPAWMGEKDAQGDLVGDWAKQVDYQTFKCRWCQKVCICIFLFDLNINYLII